MLWLAALFGPGEYKRAGMAPFVRIAPNMRKLGVDYIVADVRQLPPPPPGVWSRYNGGFLMEF